MSADREVVLPTGFNSMAWVLNILFPGVGLILRRREWLGLSHAVLFSLCANLAIAAWLIAPEAIPSWLAFSAAALAVATWVGAQLLFARQLATAKRRAHALDALAREAVLSMGSGRLDVARVTLESALEIDGEHPQIVSLWARLCTLEGDAEGARTAWQRLLKMDGHQPYAAEARQALKTSG